MTRKYILNDKASPAVVERGIDALLRASGGRLRRLDGYAGGVKVVVRADAAADSDEQVAVISGGGSGHEPGYAGMVGQGLLAAAVCGDVFASPSASAVYQAIRAVAGKAGVVVVVMNYMGDRLQFGKAVERARAEMPGVPISMVVVADDVALHPHPQPRGVAGTLFVMKAACAAAARRAPHQEVVAVANAMAKKVKTIGVSLNDCTVPSAVQPGATPPPPRLALEEMELGLGIHGEKGREIVPLETSERIAGIMVSRLRPHVAPAAGEQLVALVNNLGTATPAELTQFTADALNACDAASLPVAAHAAGHFVTSLDMHGVSLSLVPVSDAELALLDAPIPPCPGWKEPLVHAAPTAAPLPLAADVETSAIPVPGTPSAPADAAVVERCLRAACCALVAAEPELTEMDKQVGDADCGQTLKQGAEAVLQAVERGEYPLADVATTLGKVAGTMEASMGGTSGALYVLAAQAAAAKLRSGGTYAAAFTAAVEAISFYGGAAIGDCTMQDALIPAAVALGEGQPFLAVAAAAQTGAASTAALRAVLGRASYLAEDQVVGVMDPGAVACARWIEAVVKEL